MYKISKQDEADLARAVAEDKANPGDGIASARYSKRTDTVTLTLQSGVCVSIPRTLLQDLADYPAGAAVLSSIEIEGPGTMITWPRIDVSFHIDGLMQGVFGSRSWMKTIQSKGGRARSLAKSTASRANGAKGGRPRKYAA